MPKEKNEGTVQENMRAESRDAKEAKRDAALEGRNLGNPETRSNVDDGEIREATVVIEGPVAGLQAPELTEAQLEEGPTDVNPEEGLVPGSQVPVFTPGVYAPVSTQLLPNDQRDAQLVLAAEQDVDGDGIPDQRSLRFDPDATGPRDARDLAILLRRYPHWVNELHNLEHLEKTEGGIVKPDSWVAHPTDLLAEAKKFNFFFIATNGNLVARSE